MWKCPRERTWKNSIIMKLCYAKISCTLVLIFVSLSHGMFNASEILTSTYAKVAKWGSGSSSFSGNPNGQGRSGSGQQFYTHSSIADIKSGQNLKQKKELSPVYYHGHSKVDMISTDPLPGKGEVIQERFQPPPYFSVVPNASQKNRQRPKPDNPSVVFASPMFVTPSPAPNPPRPVFPGPPIVNSPRPPPPPPPPQPAAVPIMFTPPRQNKPPAAPNPPILLSSPPSPPPNPPQNRPPSNPPSQQPIVMKSPNQPPKMQTKHKDATSRNPPSYDSPYTSYNPPMPGIQKPPLPPPSLYDSPYTSYNPPKRPDQMKANVKPPTSSYDSPYDSYSPPMKDAAQMDEPKGPFYPPVGTYLPPRDSYGPPKNSYGPPMNAAPPPKQNKMPEYSYLPPKDAGHQIDMVMKPEMSKTPMDYAAYSGMDDDSMEKTSDDKGDNDHDMDDSHDHGHDHNHDHRDDHSHDHGHDHDSDPNHDNGHSDNGPPIEEHQEHPPLDDDDHKHHHHHDHHDDQKDDVEGLSPPDDYPPLPKYVEKDPYKSGWADLYPWYHHHHHVYKEHHHKTTTTTEKPKEEKRVSQTHYSYYYLGRKLWYIPLYFSVYFIVYITILILKSIARHKVTLVHTYPLDGKGARSFDENETTATTMSAIEDVQARFAM